MGERLDSFHGDPGQSHWRAAAWLLAFALPLATGIAYLALQDGLWWWLIGVAGIPLFLLVISRQEWLDRTGDEPEPPSGGMTDGPWGPP